nr:hypothetical protein [Tanacetum cinerariifolium]
MYKIHTDHTQARTSKLPQDSKKTNKSVSFSTGVIPITGVSRPQLKSNPKGDRVLRSNSHGKKLAVEEHQNQTHSHAGFQDTEKEKEEGTHTYMLFPVLSGSKNSQNNNNKDVLIDGKEHDDDIQNFMSPDIHSSSNECTNNSSNGVNAASSSVSTTGHNCINSTNDFSASGPSDTTASPIAANISDMPNLEDLTHSNDTNDVGAEADINNLESIISVSPIPTTIIHKDHSTSQIIGDLSSTTQTRSMARAVRDQGLSSEEGSSPYDDQLQASG